MKTDFYQPYLKAINTWFKNTFDTPSKKLILGLMLTYIAFMLLAPAFISFFVAVAANMALWFSLLTITALQAIGALSHFCKVPMPSFITKPETFTAKFQGNLAVLAALFFLPLMPFVSARVLATITAPVFASLAFNAQHYLHLAYNKAIGKKVTATDIKSTTTDIDKIVHYSAHKDTLAFFNVSGLANSFK